MIDSGRGAADAEAAHGAPTQSHVLQIILVYGDHFLCLPRVGRAILAPDKTLTVPVMAILMLTTGWTFGPRLEVRTSFPSL